MQLKLNELWDGTIEKFNVDILRNTLSFKLKVIANEVSKEFNLIFKGVSSFYFIEDIGEKRYNLNKYDNNDYMELTSIDYYEKGIGKITIDSLSEDWATQWKSSANFTIELWNSILFLEAKCVVINDESFDISYPCI
ncbi:hypothetical protein I6U51_03680 [Clostridium aciditolerans]|uniref:Uncharacterized protein n=1 Tax=Clostridium aciditolerans TaxID=339861 RepID=A0A934HP27_9CLOT|nr:hypothetical protein [Clostridium aciditolerans]